VNVPDNRLDTLAAISNTERIVPATVEFVDIAGLVKVSESQKNVKKMTVPRVQQMVKV
jgi:ribosome-binding ATPase YchF (GTP1/OBG family)